jgi:hypothetical protein
MRKILFASLLFLVAGCTTIHLDNGTVANPKTVSEKWHHNVVLALVEVSDPVDLKKECNSSDWASVKTQLSFINGLASSVVGMILPAIWYPKTVEVSCK